MSLQVALKETQDQLGKVLTTMREVGLQITEAEGKGEATAELDEKFNKANTDFERLTKRIEGFQTSIAREQALTKQVTNPVLATDPKDALRIAGTAIPEEKLKLARSIEREVFKGYLRFGSKDERYGALIEKAYKAVEREVFALLGTEFRYGEALVPEDFRAEVVKNLAGVTVMRRAGARVVPTSSSTLVYPSIAGGTDPFSTGFEGSWRAEGSQGTDGSAPATQNQPTFGQERIPVHVWQPAAIILTRELLEDSAAPLDSILSGVIAETKGQDEDGAFIKGTGVGQPRGIVDYVGAASGPAISTVVSGDANLLKYDGLVDLFHTLPIQYRDMAVFFLRSSTMGAILKLKDSSQMPLLYQNALPGTLFGRPVFITEHMPAVAANAFPVIFGAPGFYCIAERTDLRVQRLEERFAPNVGMLPTARLGGGVVRTQAFIAQKVST